MTSFRIAFTELRRITSGRMPRLAVAALIAVPTLYAGLYLYTNHDPYGGLERVPTALVVSDTGATFEGKEVNFGQDLADRLTSNGDFDWHVVDATAAQDGVRDGTYDFALTIPTGFSQAITSPARFEPEQARLIMTTNDANSYLSSTIADTLITRVRAALSQEVTERSATTFLQSFGDIRTKTVEAADGSEKLAKGLTTAKDGTTKLHAGARELAAGLGKLQRGTRKLPAQSQKLADGAAEVSAGNAKVAGVGDEAAQVARTTQRLYRDGRSDLRALMNDQGLTPAQKRAILAVYDDLDVPLDDVATRVEDASDKLDRLASGSSQVAAGAAKLSESAPKLADGIAQAHSGAVELRQGTRKLDRGVDRLRAGADKLATGLADGVKRIPDLNSQTVKDTARTLALPIDVANRAESKAGSYGAGLAPFFLVLSAWIGGYVLFLLVQPLSTRAIAANQASSRIALGGWYPPALLGLAQMALVLTVVSLGVGIKSAHVLPTLLFMMLVSITFIAIVHALNAWLGPVGQFLGLALMVLQLTTAGGTFPWQTIPPPVHFVHQLLPMSYGVDGLRQLMYGGLSSLVWNDVLVLALWLFAALALSSLAARRHRTWTVSRIKPELTL